MKHAGASALAGLAPLRRRLCEETPLVERTPGAFYFKSRAFLHFHEDAGGTIHADVKLDAAGFTRIRATTAAEQARLLALVTGALEPLR